MASIKEKTRPLPENPIKMKRILLLPFLLFSFLTIIAQNKAQITEARLLNPAAVEILFSDHQRLTLDFYNEHIFRMFQDNNGGIIRDPQAVPPAQILVDNPRRGVKNLKISTQNNTFIIETDAIKVAINKESTLLKISNKRTGKVVLESVAPFAFTPKSVTWKLKENADEYFYGGGVQNGRFSHKGKHIAIENQNSWTDGGVASPNPFYWSTYGYAIMWHTFKKGEYDFASKEKNVVTLSHQDSYLDVFVMINDGAVALLNDFYQLTGNPVLMPKFSFYQGHLNAYNRDYWKEDEEGILFEDGKRYKESQKDNGGIKESLNGENNNYQFSARAVIDRYKAYDMPLGWLLPNDGYGAGYGQSETLDGNIANLKSLGDYARKHGVEIGLWTQSDLHPKDSISALLQRDIVKEVRDAGVLALKTDVAWVGAGYSFGLNGVADVAYIMPYYGNDARPFIISLDGWAGTQRYAGIWSGDQTGGQWEYIRFHIPTYLGSGLSGNPNISSDMDGIFGGKNVSVNVRDFQWKTFTPMQLNMDGWGSNPKYPHILGEPATSINRFYLKLKSELMPYAYSVAHQAIEGMPMVRAMFLEYPNAYTLGKSTQYQFLYGPYFLVAPIYQSTQADTQGNDVRHGIYLPEGLWFDYFTGQAYRGNRIINHYDAPLWKLPVFVKAGAIIPITHPHNNVTQIDPKLRKYEIYPGAKNTFVEYDDDGRTQAYLRGAYVSTSISSEWKNNELMVQIAPTKGNFNGFEKNKRTELNINTSVKPKRIRVKWGNKTIKLKEVTSESEFENSEDVYFYNEKRNLNQFATSGSVFEKVVINKNPQLQIKISEKDITQSDLILKISGVGLSEKDNDLSKTGSLEKPTEASVEEQNRTAYTLKPQWKAVSNADYYEIDFEGMRYSTIKTTELLFEDLVPETSYKFAVRAVNESGQSDWVYFEAQTKANPLEFAIKGITATTSCKNQSSQGVEKLFDFDSSNMWHTDWSNTQAVPFEMVISLNTVNQLDKMEYLPRNAGLNGMIQEGTVYTSHDKVNWVKSGTFSWVTNHNTKIFEFADKPTARFVKIQVTKAVGGFGSGQELYIFKVPNTESYLPGDINHDGVLDSNDFTSYLNYTGLRKTDADFDYVSKGDINQNGLIDAYDISAVATVLNGGVSATEYPMVSGAITLQPDRNTYVANQIVGVMVKGKDLKSVNALSMALDYNPQDYEFVGVEPLAVKHMENMTNDRLHSNARKGLYPTFVNMGEKPLLNGNTDLFVLKFRAKRSVTFQLKAQDIILVDTKLNSVVK
ncbi:TIM-barrel domain-containing protein [Capnocytophaga canimorsus]|uniref:TIM-barrel domain-containing protein n=1 Tax=Capnocytophaga canimorsus TaxID=28188 RepID=UPI00385E24A6